MVTNYNLALLYKLALFLINLFPNLEGLMIIEKFRAVIENVPDVTAVHRLARERVVIYGLRVLESLYRNLTTLSLSEHQLHLAIYLSVWLLQILVVIFEFSL